MCCWGEVGERGRGLFMSFLQLFVSLISNNLSGFLLPVFTCMILLFMILALLEVNKKHTHKNANMI